jgi:AMMECR1 domain-containing protein
MYTLVRKTLEIYLKEKRIITQTQFPQDVEVHLNSQNAVFVTLYLDERVIASSGRIQCKKQNTVYECIDNTLLCLKDSRFHAEIQNPESLEKIHIRVDYFWKENRRLLQSINDLDVGREWILLLSQNKGVMSIILPHMMLVWATPASLFSLACKKAWLDEQSLKQGDYVIYGVSSTTLSDFA